MKKTRSSQESETVNNSVRHNQACKTRIVNKQKMREVTVKK